MGRLLRFLVLLAVVLVTFVLVGLPLILSPVLTQMVRDTGIDAATLEVSVAPFDPTLILGRARRITLRATDVDVAPAHIGNVDLDLGDVSALTRTFETVSGEMDDITLTTSVGDSVHVNRVAVDGPAQAANATASLSAADTDQLIRLAARRAGISIDQVTVGDNGVTVEVNGHDASARLAVTGGALVLDPGVGEAIVLFQPAPSDPWRLQEAWVTADGLNVRGILDVAALTARLRQ